ncbi:hypothetical protein RSOLAG1IB_10112 [Rhizoctonia solani AG-1 IB]|uniref:DUF6535 domain-containing protein n=1 Tax=Thanatephorus cucumeris (strain AG1-IB / isolate 7/3/14) TaxID=1108050 RepID=A0A0B7FXF3_THACB|nr:hypothetical protein RSOLAG1IB_10112 [Rhizoctonia solani AG-1 IB]
MSFLIPGNLSESPINRASTNNHKRRGSMSPTDQAEIQYGSAPFHESDDLEYSDHHPYIHTGFRRDSRGHARTNKGPSVDHIPLEFDQHGAELGKDARFWKVYVKETDHWDEELVHGWNKSLDVTLVFAALFSAILTAFLIESSSRLREDSGDQVAKTLFIISRTLSSLANGTQPEQITSNPDNQDTAFAPSHAAVLVSTLWYLSLSLSVATSFLAMLGKNWCHSFMSGRAGHACIQARRRQQKWTMIERWKMRELLAMLPSLIHLALLLFSIGLCIYVWELNRTVALPVMCVTGIAVGFYICSSLAASILDFFPYTTTTSRILRSKPMKEVYLVALWILQPVLVFLAFIPILFLIITERLAQCYRPLHRRADGWLESFVEWSNRSLVMLPRNFPEGKHDENPKQDKVTSNALYWIIRNCEVLSSVDIALQVIAGANRELPRQPLEACKAALLISRRLVSGRLYKESAKDRQRISLYVRALSFLGSNFVSEQHGSFKPNTEGAEVMIWDLQSINENEAASLIIDGNFMPSDHNLLALRIGSTAASQGLRKLGGQNEGTVVEISQLFKQHLAGTHELHSAALVSLANTAILLSVCSPCGINTIPLASLCMQLFDRNRYWLNIEPKYGITLAMCALLQNADAERGRQGDQVNVYWVHSALHALLETQNPKKKGLGKLAWFATAEVLSNPEAYNINFLQAPKLRHLLDSAIDSFSSIWEAIPKNQHLVPNEAFIECHLDNLQRVYTLACVGAPVAEVYVFVVECMCRTSSKKARDLCGSLMSKFRFPKLSTELVKHIERRDLVKVLENALRHEAQTIQLFAVSQLWLLHALYLDSYSDCEADKDKLLHQLRVHSPGVGQSIGQVKCYLEDRTDLIIQCLGPEFGPLKVYADRVKECILQTRAYPESNSEWEKIRKSLIHIPHSLRGLSSFTQLPMRSPLKFTLPITHPCVSIQINSV